MEPKKTLVIQTYGKHLNDVYKETYYEIDGRLFKKKLVSDAISEYFNNADLLFLVPESLFVNDVYNYDELKDLIRNKDEYKERYRNKIIEQLENSENGRNIYLIRMVSIGYYDNFSNKEGKVHLSLEFDTNLDFIKLVLLKDLFDIINQYDRIIIDLSTGLNYYLPIILDVFRYLISYQKLSHKLNENYKTKEYKITTSPPVIQSKTTINIEKFDAKAFFDLPENVDFNRIYPKISNDPNKIKEENIEFKNLFNKELEFLKKINRNTRLGFNAIVNNTPLIFYDNNIIDLDYEDLKKSSDDILKENIFKILDFFEYEKTDISINENKMIVRRPKIDGGNYFNLIMEIGIYENIREIRNEILNSFYENKMGDDENNVATTEDLIKKFTSIYDKLNYKINRRFLERDIEEIESFKSVIPNEYKPYIDIKFNPNKKDTKENQEEKTSDIKRNFFAHSGLEYSMILIKSNVNKIFLKYNNHLDEIKKWLSE